MIYIGIDPGRQTGIAEWNPHEQRFEDHGFHTVDFWGAIKFINDYIRAGCAFKVVLENPNLNRPVFFPKPKPGQKPIPEPVKLKKAQDVGRNKEDAYLIQQYCELKGIECVEIRPATEKWNHKTFINLTKLSVKTTNEHVRDAARLVWKL